LAGSTDPTEEYSAQYILTRVIQPQLSNGMTLTIAIGNEPFLPGNNAATPFDTNQLEQAYTNIRGALRAAGLLGTAVKLTVPFSMEVLCTEGCSFPQGQSVTYPPTNGRFETSSVRIGQQSAREVIGRLAAMMFEDGSEFAMNMYPYFTRKHLPESVVPLNYALGAQTHTVGGVTYHGLLDAQIAAARHALLELDGRYTETALPLVVSETGWPTSGHAIATVNNAQAYANYVADYAERPGSTTTVYLFEAFDEQLKSQSGHTAGHSEEDHFGLFAEDGTAKFAITALEA